MAPPNPQAVRAEPPGDRSCFWSGKKRPLHGFHSLAEPPGDGDAVAWWSEPRPGSSFSRLPLGLLQLHTAPLTLAGRCRHSLAGFLLSTSRAGVPWVSLGPGSSPHTLSAPCCGHRATFFLSVRLILLRTLLAWSFWNVSHCHISLQTLHFPQGSLCMAGPVQMPVGVA